MDDFPQPKHYLLQYLLIPLRVILVLPLLVGVISLGILAKLLLSAIGFITIGILLGAGWLIDGYVWPGFTKSGIATLLGILTFFPLWYGVAYCFGGVIEKAKLFPGLASFSDRVSTKIGKWWEGLTDFIFEAKYKESYLDMFGPDFPEPKFKDFNLEKEDYYAYNRRLEFGELASTFAIGATAFSFWYFHDKKLEGQFQYGNIVQGISIGILVFLVLKGIDALYAKRFPQHEAVRRYSFAKKAYDSIQEEHRKAKFEKEWAAKQELKARLKVK